MAAIVFSVVKERHDRKQGKQCKGHQEGLDYLRSSLVACYCLAYTVSDRSL